MRSNILIVIFNEKIWQHFWIFEFHKVGSNRLQVRWKAFFVFTYIIFLWIRWQKVHICQSYYQTSTGFHFWDTVYITTNHTNTWIQVIAQILLYTVLHHYCQLWKQKTWADGIHHKVSNERLEKMLKSAEI